MNAGSRAGSTEMSCLRLAPSFALGLRNRLAQSPQGVALRPGCRGDRILDEAALDGRGEGGLEARGECLVSCRERGFGEDVPGMRLAERVARTRNMSAGEFERDARHELEGRHRVAERFAQAAEKRERCGRCAEADECGRNRGGSRKQAQRRRRHDAERALGADEELLEVIARVVLAQCRELVQHAPVRQHDLEAEHEGTHHAVAQHGRAAGIGRDDAAQRRAALGAERHRQQPVDGGRRGLQFGEHAARFRGQGVVLRGHRADLPHAPQRQQDLVAAWPRRRTAAIAGVAALRHDGDALARAQLDEACNARGRIRQCDERRSAAMQPPEVDLEWLAIGGGLEPAARTEHVLQRLQGGRRHGGDGAIHAGHLTERRVAPQVRAARGDYFASPAFSSGFGFASFLGFGGGAPTPSAMRRSSDSCSSPRMRQSSTMPIRR